ncbi:DUF4882 family protein [Acinetobacter seifertii]|uniref:DUF4882 family protein n=1 Tax=Acinetobacter seifertii TaxID=1530123 RepID=UPI003F51D43A
MKKMSILGISIVMFIWAAKYADTSLSSDDLSITAPANSTIMHQTFLGNQQEVSKFSLTKKAQPVYRKICQYNFDADQEDFDLWNMQNIEEDTPIKKFPLIKDQEFGFIIDSIPKDQYPYIEYVAESKNKLNSTNDIGDFLLPTKGIIALEMELKVPVIELDKSNYISTIFITGTTNNQYTVRLHYGFNSGAYSTDFKKIPPNINYSLTYRLSNLNGPIYSYYDSRKLSLNTDNYQRLGIYINQTTRQVGFILNGVDLGYTSKLPAPLENISFMITNSAGVFSEHLLGRELSSELITDRNALKFNYPQGTTDMCGNAL